MRKNYSIYLLIFGLLISVNSKAQLVSTFDDLNLDIESYWNGSDESGSFISGPATFMNSYNASWFSWSGFAYSNVTDNYTEGYANQYSSYAGEGAKASSNYGVCYAESSDTIAFDGTKNLVGIYVSNATYTALSMKNGDDFAKKFGGSEGNDPDWFMLTIEAYNAERQDVGNVEFYLADYRFDNNEEDYIVEDWQRVDLTSLKGVAYLTFSLSSSDFGDWGMNTPGYFCIDNLQIFKEISFVVSDGTNALENVSIEFAGENLMTDINGEATFSSVSPTTEMNVVASKEGYGQYQSTIDGTTTEVHNIILMGTAVMDLNKLVFKMYPNPATDVLMIGFESEINSIQIYNLSGQMVLQKLLLGGNSATIAIGELSSGAYIVEVLSKQGIARKQLIKR